MIKIHMLIQDNNIDTHCISFNIIYIKGQITLSVKEFHYITLYSP